MKWLIVIGLIALLVMFVAARYRRHIQMAIYVFRMFRKMKSMSKADAAEKEIEGVKKQTDDVQLVRCAKCGSWTPQPNALSFGKGTFYCSNECIETAVEVGR